MRLKKFESFDDNNFCVYVFLNPSKPGEYTYGEYTFEFEPIYVGKGRSSRPKNHLYKFKNGKTYFYKKLSSLIGSGHEPMWIIVNNNLTEREAFDEEVKLIKLIGRKNSGGVLSNLTDGGEGQTGYNHREESKIKISNSLKNNKDWLDKMKSKEHRDKLSKSLMGHEGHGKGNHRTQEVKDKIRLSVLGDKNHFFGKSHSDELKSVMSKRNTGKGNPNSKIYKIDYNGEILYFEGRIELKDYLNKFNIQNNLKGPNRVSFENLINRGYSKDFKLLSIDRLN
jgi:hypothetical protein